MNESNAMLNLQATNFIVTSATKGGWLPPPRIRVRFKILYSVIHRLIQHYLLSKMVYLNVKYFIATRSYDFFIYTQNLFENIPLWGFIISVSLKREGKNYKKRYKNLPLNPL